MHISSSKLEAEIDELKLWKLNRRLFVDNLWPRLLELLIHSICQHAATTV